MDKELQLIINRYICFRLLEVECGFSSVYDEQYESYYISLDKHFWDTMRRIPSYEIPTVSYISELKKHYISILRGAVIDFVRNGDNIDKNTIHILFIITRYLVVHYKRERKGDCAYFLCIWLNNLLDKCDIEWNNSFIKNQRRHLMNRVGSTLFYWCYEIIVQLRR